MNMATHRTYAFRPTAALLARIALGAFGVWVASIGVRALWPTQSFGASPSTGRWLIGGVIAHDAIIAPVVFVLGAIVARFTSARTRQALAAILLIGGSALIVGLPNALHKGQNPNPTVNPLDYTRNLIIVILAVVGGVVLVTSASAARGRRRERRAAEVAVAVAEVDTDMDMDTKTAHSVQSVQAAQIDRHADREPGGAREVEQESELDINPPIEPVPSRQLEPDGGGIAADQDAEGTPAGERSAGQADGSGPPHAVPEA
ncbi:MAG: hypothetical protein ACRDVE_07015 [Actinocrinis sp.]